MKFSVFAFFFALIALSAACLGGGGGGQCCPPAQPSCGNPCGGGVGPAPVGPAAYVAAPPAGNAYPVGK